MDKVCCENNYIYIIPASSQSLLERFFASPLGGYVGIVIFAFCFDWLIP